MECDRRVGIAGQRTRNAQRRGVVIGAVEGCCTFGVISVRPALLAKTPVGDRPVGEDERSVRTGWPVLTLANVVVGGNLQRRENTLVESDLVEPTKRLEVEDRLIADLKVARCRPKRGVRQAVSVPFDAIPIPERVPRAGPRACAELTVLNLKVAQDTS